MDVRKHDSSQKKKNEKKGEGREFHNDTEKAATYNYLVSVFYII